MGVVAADFDNDGWEDLYVTCYGPNRLYRNNGDGTFSDVTGKAAVGDPRWSTGAAFADYDGDGWLDLFVANYVDVRLDALPEFGKGKFCEFHGIPVQCGPRGLRGSGDTLYRNKGDGTFEDVSMKAGVADVEGRFGMGVAWSDFDLDGRPDLYVANDTGPNYLYKNNGNGTFVDVALQAGTALSEDGKAQGSMGVAIGDYDHSGGWSIFVTNFSNEYNALYKHEKAFQFTDASFRSQTAKPNNPYVGWGTHFLDYDNDGWQDLLVVNGHVYPQVERTGLAARYAQRKLLYRNQQNGTFAEVTPTAGPALNEPSVSRGSAAGDLDNDGDLDVVINNLDGAPTVLRNDGGNRGNFLVIDLEGRTGNRSAVGALVAVRAGDLVQRAERRSGDSYLSHSDARLHFGLGTRTTVDSIEVRWPNGAVQRFGEIPANTFIKIVEGANAPRDNRKAEDRIGSLLRGEGQGGGASATSVETRHATTVRLRPGPKVEITPKARPGGCHDSIRDPLFARVIVVDDGSTCAVLVGFDLGAASTVVTDAIARASASTGCPAQNFLISATHTHSSNTAGPGSRPADGQAVADAIVEAATVAKSKLAPARIGYGTTNVDLNVNRDLFNRKLEWRQEPNPDGPSDKTLAVVEFLGADNVPIGVYMNYAMHPINFYLSGVISADFPGEASRYVEDLFDDRTVAIFSQGASGDQNPRDFRSPTTFMGQRAALTQGRGPFVQTVGEPPVADGASAAGFNAQRASSERTGHPRRESGRL